MNFFAMPTLKKVRSCLRRPISIMPRFSLKLTLARVRTGMARVGSWLRCAAVTTVSAILMSFFSTAPLLFAFFRAMLVSRFRFFAGIVEAQAHLVVLGGFAFGRRCFARFDGQRQIRQGRPDEL